MTYYINTSINHRNKLSYTGLANYIASIMELYGEIRVVSLRNIILFVSRFFEIT